MNWIFKLDILMYCQNKSIAKIYQDLIRKTIIPQEISENSHSVRCQK